MQPPRVVDSYELSPTQEGMLFHGLLGESTGVDIEQIVCTFEGPFDAASLIAGFERVTARHPILRTRFAYDGAGRPLQEVLDSVPIPVDRLDLRPLEAGRRGQALADALRRDRARGIDLRQAPAMRLLLVDLGPEEHSLVWTFHHALLDGRSFPLVLREVFARQRAAVDEAGRPPSLPRPYREYIEFLRGRDLVAAEAHFRGLLQGFTAPTPLTIDRALDPGEGEGEGARWTDGVQGASERRIGLEATAALRSFAAAAGVTLNTLLQAAWAILLHRYSRETDVVFGATRACRRSAFADADSMVGLFINTLPLRVRLSPEQRLGELLAEVRAQQVEARAFEHTPLAKVQGWSQVPRGRPLFDSLVVYENQTLAATLRDLDTGPARVRFAYHGQTNYPLTLIGYGDDRLLLRLENDRRRVDDAAAARMLGHLVTLLLAMPAHADRPLRELPLLTAEELAALELSRAPQSFPVERCLHQRFEEQVRRVPDRVAAVCGDDRLTYAELDRRANGLAWKLRALGVGPESLVAIRTDRSLDIVVGILGILKAGGAYLPLDPAYPRERVEFMLADSQVAVVVTEAALAADFAGTGAALVLVDAREEAASGPATGVTPDHLAYVIYTSGSTGKPKGVLIDHRNVARLFEATSAWFQFGEDDVWTLFHSYAFDFSVWELWGALLHGGRLVVVPYWVSRAPESFRELLLRERVTVLNQTPSAFRQLIQADLQAGPPVPTHLRYVIFGGEALDLQSLRPWFERHGEARPRLVNMYGITETTVHVTYRPITGADLVAGAGSVIGVPIPDLKLILLDPDGAPVPIGVPGEIHVGGAGLSRGYLGRPELTAQRFVPDPFAGGSGARLYRAGDLARRLEGGDLEYLGRIDDQVKIRGFRIELGEIEAVIAQLPGVAEAVVMVREDAPGDRRLVAYFVAAGEPQAPPAAAPPSPPALVDRLRSHLRARLPEYMVPPHLVVLPRLPLTANGKVDRKALPAPERGSRDGARPLLLPRTPVEQALAAVWSEVLGVPRLGIDDNFFELGGDSILTIQIIARCRDAGLRFSPRDLARRPTIAELAEVVTPLSPAREAEPEAIPGPVQPTPIVRWFFALPLEQPGHWNQAFLFEVPAGLQMPALERALGEVIAHHDALRLRAVPPPASAPGSWGLRQEPRSQPPEAPPIERLDLGALPPAEHAAAIERAAARAQAELDIVGGPVLAARLFDRGALPGRLLLALHHLVVDGVSWRLLIEDLEAAYAALVAGTPVRLPPRSTSFQRWSEVLAAYAATPAPAASLSRWQEILAADPSLPAAAGAAADDREALAGSLTVSLDTAETQALLSRVPAAHRTQINDVLLTALALALRGWSGREVHRIDTEGHGREPWIGPVEPSRTVGWFTSLYPLALDLRGLGAPGNEGAALERVRDTLQALPDHGLSYGVLRYLAPDHAVREALASAPPAELLFNYLGQFDQVVAGSRLFRFADEATGPWHGPANRRTHRLEVIALVREGRLEARWIHGRERDAPEVVARLAEAFLAALRRLIRHCLEAGAARPRPADFPLARLDEGALDRLLLRYPDLEDVYPLSPMQRLFLSMEGGGARLGFEQWVFGLRGPLDRAALRRAWEATCARHAILRTAFVADGPGQPLPLQVVRRQATLPWAEEDLSAAAGAEQAARLEGLLAADRERGFEVAVAPLCRLTLIRLSDQEHRLLWSTHHLCVDGWSWPLVLREVAAAYAAPAGVPAVGPAPGAPGQYGSYIGWLAQAAPDSRGFWQERLDGFRAPTPLPADPEGAPAAGQGSYERSLRLPAATTAALSGLARSLQITLSTVVQGAWAVLLGHLSGDEDVVFGAALSGRPAELPAIEELVGPCVNNLPVRVRLDGAEPVAAALRALHADNLEVAQHQFAALADIQQWAGIPLRLRLFDSLVVFQNYLVGEAARRLAAVELEPLQVPETTNYPLTLTVTPGNELSLKLVAAAGRLGPASLATMLDGLASVLADFAALAGEPRATLAEVAARLPSATRGSARASQPAARRAGYVAPAGEMERQVARVWQELFGVEAVGSDDNFFDLGGHSLLLLEAHARLRAATGADLSIVALLQYPTVRSLARYLSQGAAGPTPSDAAAERARLQRQALARQRDLRGKR